MSLSLFFDVQKPENSNFFDGGQDYADTFERRTEIVTEGYQAEGTGVGASG